MRFSSSTSLLRFITVLVFVLFFASSSLASDFRAGIVVAKADASLMPIGDELAADYTGNTKSGRVMQVWSYNEASQKLELNTVKHVFVHQDDDITTLTIRNSETNQFETITTTPEHPFFVKSNSKLEFASFKNQSANFDWVGAGKLKAGSIVWKKNGSTGIVSSVRTTARTRAMYNLEVARAHTYFVGKNHWLVHNAARPWMPCSKILGEVGTASAEVTTYAEKANQILEAIPDKPFMRDVTIAVGRNAEGKLIISACCRPGSLDYLSKMQAENRLQELLGEPFEFLQPIRRAPNFIKTSKEYREFYHAERIIFNEGIDKIGISRIGGLCKPCQGIFDAGLLEAYPEFEIGVYAKDK
jgi:hypothetical protein